jgi:hypothetical protein
MPGRPSKAHCGCRATNSFSVTPTLSDGTARNHFGTSATPGWHYSPTLLAILSPLSAGRGRLLPKLRSLKIPTLPIGLSNKRIAGDLGQAKGSVERKPPVSSTTVELPRFTPEYERRAGSSSCPLWVKSRSRGYLVGCPLHPRRRTWLRTALMSALCQKATLPRSLSDKGASFASTTGLISLDRLPMEWRRSLDAPAQLNFREASFVRTRSAGTSLRRN